MGIGRLLVVVAVGQASFPELPSRFLFVYILRSRCRIHDPCEHLLPGESQRGPRESTRGDNVHLPRCDLGIRRQGFRGEAPGLDRFSQLIRKQKILDATRAILITGVRGNRTRMMLNKQVATVGKVSFADRNPVLGAIEVFVEDDDLLGLIDRVAPITVDGEEVKI